jgi:hypothetical protein
MAYSSQDGSRFFTRTVKFEGLSVSMSRKYAFFFSHSFEKMRKPVINNNARRFSTS